MKTNCPLQFMASKVGMDVYSMLNVLSKNIIRTYLFFEGFIDVVCKERVYFGGFGFVVKDMTIVRFQVRFCGNSVGHDCTVFITLHMVVRDFSRMSIGVNVDAVDQTFCKNHPTVYEDAMCG